MLFRRALVLTEILAITSYAVGQLGFSLHGSNPLDLFGIGLPVQVDTQFKYPTPVYVANYGVEFVQPYDNIVVQHTSWPRVRSQYPNAYMTVSHTLQRMTRAAPTLTIQSSRSTSYANSLSISVNTDHRRRSDTIITFPPPPAYLIGRPFRFVKVTVQDHVPTGPRAANVRYLTFDSPLMRDYAVQYIRVEPVAMIPPHDNSDDLYYVTFVVMGDRAYIPRYHYFKISLHIGYSSPTAMLLALPPAESRPPKLYLRLEALEDEPTPYDLQNVNVPILYLRLEVMWTKLNLPEFWIKPMRFPVNALHLHVYRFRYVILSLELHQPRTPQGDSVRYIELANSIMLDPAILFLKLVPVPVIDQNDVEADVQYISLEVPEEHAQGDVPQFLYFRIVPVRGQPTNKEPHVQYLQLFEQENPRPPRLFLKIETVNKLPKEEITRNVAIFKIKVQPPRGPKLWLTVISFPPNADSNDRNFNRYLRATLYELPPNEPQSNSVRLISFSSPVLQDPNVQFIKIEPVPELGTHYGEPDVHILKVRTPDDEQFDNNPRFQYFTLVPTRNAEEPDALYLTLPPVENTPRPSVLYVKIEALDHEPSPPSYPNKNVAILKLEPVAILPLNRAKRLSFPWQNKHNPEDGGRYLKATLLSLKPREPKGSCVRFFKYTSPLLQDPLFKTIEIDPIPHIEHDYNDPGVYFLKVKMPDDEEFDNSPRYQYFRVGPHTGPRQPNGNYIDLPPLNQRPPTLYLRIEAGNDQPINLDDPSINIAVIFIRPAPYNSVPPNLKLKTIRFPPSKSINAIRPKRYVKVTLQDHTPNKHERNNVGYISFTTNKLLDPRIQRLSIETVPGIDGTDRDPHAQFLKVETPDEEEFDGSPRFYYLRVAPNTGFSKPHVKYLSLPLNETNLPAYFVEIEALDDEPEQLENSLTPSGTSVLLELEPVENKPPPSQKSPKYIRFPPNQSTNPDNPRRYLRATIESNPSMEPKTDSVRYLRFLLPENATVHQLQITPVLDEDENDMNVHLLRVERPEDTEFEDSPPYRYFRFGPDSGSPQPKSKYLPTPHAPPSAKKPFYVRVEALPDEPIEPDTPRPHEAILPVEPTSTTSAIKKPKKISFPQNKNKQPLSPVRYIQATTHLRPPREAKNPSMQVLHFPSAVLADPSVENIKIEPVDGIDENDQKPYVSYVKVVTPDATEFDDSPPEFYLRVGPNTGASSPNAKYLELPTLSAPAVYVRFKALNDEPEEPTDSKLKPVLFHISPYPHSSPSKRRKPKRIIFPPNRSTNPKNPARYLHTTLEPERSRESEGDSVQFLPLSLETLRDRSIEHVEVELVPEISKDDTDPDVQYVKIDKPDDEEFDDSPTNYYLRVAPNRGYSKPNAKYLRLPPAGTTPNLYIKVEALSAEPDETDQPNDGDGVIEVKPVSPFLAKKPKKIGFRPNMPDQNRPYVKTELLLEPPIEPRSPSVRFLELSSSIIQNPEIKYVKIERVPDVDEDDPEPDVHYVKVKTPGDELSKDSPHFTYLRFSPSTDDTQPNVQYLPLPAAHKSADNSDTRPQVMYIRVEAADSPQELPISKTDQLVNISKRYKNSADADELTYDKLPLDSSPNHQNPISSHESVIGGDERYPVEKPKRNEAGDEQTDVPSATLPFSKLPLDSSPNRENSILPREAVSRDGGADEALEGQQRQIEYPIRTPRGTSYVPVQLARRNEAGDEASNMPNAALPLGKLPLDSSPNRENPISLNEGVRRDSGGDEQPDEQQGQIGYPIRTPRGTSYVPVQSAHRNEAGDEASNSQNAALPLGKLPLDSSPNRENPISLNEGVRRDSGGDEQPDEQQGQNGYPIRTPRGTSYVPVQSANRNEAGDEASNMPNAALPLSKLPLDSSPNRENAISLNEGVRRDSGGDEQPDEQQGQNGYPIRTPRGTSYVPVQSANRNEAGDEASNMPNAALPLSKLPLDSSPNRENAISPNEAARRDSGDDEQPDGKQRRIGYPNGNTSRSSYGPVESTNRNEAGDDESNVPNASLPFTKLPPDSSAKENPISPREIVSREGGGDEQPDGQQRRIAYPNGNPKQSSYEPKENEKLSYRNGRPSRSIYGHIDSTNRNEAGDEESNVPNSALPFGKLPVDSSPRHENSITPHGPVNRENGGDVQPGTQQIRNGYLNGKLKKYSYLPVQPSNRNEDGDEESNVPNSANSFAPYGPVNREDEGDELPGTQQMRTGYLNGKLKKYSYQPVEPSNRNEDGDEESNASLKPVNRVNGGDEQPGVQQKLIGYLKGKLKQYAFPPDQPSNRNEVGDEESNVPNSALPFGKLPVDSSPRHENPIAPHAPVNRENGGDEQPGTQQIRNGYLNGKLKKYSYLPVQPSNRNEVGDEDSNVPNSENPFAPYGPVNREDEGDELPGTQQMRMGYLNGKLKTYSYQPVEPSNRNEDGDEESNAPDSALPFGKLPLDSSPRYENPTAPHGPVNRENGGDEQPGVQQKLIGYLKGKLKQYAFPTIQPSNRNEAEDEESNLPNSALPFGKLPVNSSPKHENPTAPHGPVNRVDGGDEEPDVQQKVIGYLKGKLKQYAFSPVEPSNRNEDGDEESNAPDSALPFGKLPLDSSPRHENPTAPHGPVNRENEGDEQPGVQQKLIGYLKGKLKQYAFPTVQPSNRNEAEDEESNVPNSALPFGKLPVDSSSKHENPIAPHGSVNRVDGGDEEPDVQQKVIGYLKGKLKQYAFSPVEPSNRNEDGDEESNAPDSALPFGKLPLDSSPRHENPTAPHGPVNRVDGGDEEPGVQQKVIGYLKGKLKQYAFSPVEPSNRNEAEDEESNVPNSALPFGKLPVDSSPKHENPIAPHGPVNRGDEEPDVHEKVIGYLKGKLKQYAFPIVQSSNRNEAEEEDSNMPNSALPFGKLPVDSSPKHENPIAPHGPVIRVDGGDEEPDVHEKLIGYLKGKLKQYAFPLIRPSNRNEGGDEESSPPNQSPIDTSPIQDNPVAPHKYANRQDGDDEQPNAHGKLAKYRNGRPSRSINAPMGLTNKTEVGDEESNVPNTALPFSQLPLDGSPNHENPISPHKSVNREDEGDEQPADQQRRIEYLKGKPNLYSYTRNEAGSDESKVLKYRKARGDREPNDGTIIAKPHSRKFPRRTKVERMKFLPKNPSDPQQRTRYIKATLEETPHKGPEKVNLKLIPFSSAVFEDPTIKNIKVEPVSDMDEADDEPNVHYVRVEAPPEEKFDESPMYKYLRVAPNRDPKMPSDQVLKLPLIKNKLNSHDEKKKPAFYVRIETHSSEPEELDSADNNNITFKVEPNPSSGDPAKKKPKRVRFPPNISKDPDNPNRYVKATIIANLPKEPRKGNVRFLSFPAAILDDPTVQNLKIEPVLSIDENDDEPNVHYMKIETPDDDEDFENTPTTKYLRFSPNRGDSQPNAKILSLEPVKMHRLQTGDVTKPVFYVRIETLGAAPEEPDKSGDDVAVLLVEPTQSIANSPKSNLKTSKRVRFPPNVSMNPNDPTRYIKATVKQQSPKTPRRDNTRYLTFPATLLEDPTVHNIAIAPVSDLDVDTPNDVSNELYPEAKYLKVEKPDDEEFEDSPIYSYFRVRPNRGNTNPNEQVLNLPKDRKYGTKPVFYVKMEALGAEPEEMEEPGSTVAYLKVKPIQYLTAGTSLPKEPNKSGQGDDEQFKNPTDHSKPNTTPYEVPHARPNSPNYGNNASGDGEPKEPHTTKTHPIVESTPSSIPTENSGDEDTSNRSERSNDEDSDEPAQTSTILRPRRIHHKKGLRKIKFPLKKSKISKDPTRYLKATALQRRGRELRGESVQFIPLRAKYLLDPSVKNIQIEVVPDVKGYHKAPDAKYVKIQKPDDEEFDNSPKYYYLKVTPNREEQHPNAKYLNLPQKDKGKYFYVRLEALGAEPEELEDGNVTFLKVSPTQLELPVGSGAKVIKFLAKKPKTPEDPQHPDSTSSFIKVVLHEGAEYEHPKENEQYIPLPRLILEDPRINFIKIEPVDEFDENETETGVSYFTVETPTTASALPRLLTFKLSPLKDDEQPNSKCLKVRPLKSTHKLPVFVKVQALESELEEPPQSDHESVFIKIDEDAPTVPITLSSEELTAPRYMLVNLQERQPSKPENPQVRYLTFTSPMIQDPTVGYIKIALVQSVNENEKNPEAEYLTVEIPERHLYFRIVPIRGKIQHRHPNVHYFNLRELEDDTNGRPSTLFIKMETRDGELEESVRQYSNLIIIRLDVTTTKTMGHAIRKTRKVSSIYQYLLIKLAEQPEETAPGVQFLPFSCEDFNYDEFEYLKIEALPDEHSSRREPGAYYLTVEIPEGAPVQQVHFKILPVKGIPKDSDPHAKYIRLPILKNRKRSNSITIYIRIELLATAPDPAVSLDYESIVLRLDEVPKTAEDVTPSPKRRLKKRHSKSSLKHNPRTTVTTHEMFHFLLVTLQRKNPEVSSQSNSLYAAITSPLFEDASVQQVKIETLDAVDPKYNEDGANFMSIQVPTRIGLDAPLRDLHFKIVPIRGSNKRRDPRATYLRWVEDDDSERTDTIYIQIQPLVEEPAAVDSNGMVIKL